MHQHKTRMGEVEFTFRKPLHPNVLSTYLQVVERERPKKARFNVDCEYASLVPYSLAEPGCNGTAAAPDLKARPSPFNAGPLQMLDSLRIVKS